MQFTRNSLIVTRYFLWNLAMAWALLLLCIVLGCLGTLRPSGRAADFKRMKEE